MRAGECAGTRAFIDGAPRQVTLRAKGAVQILTLEPGDFEALVDAQPRLV